MKHDPVLVLTSDPHLAANLACQLKAAELEIVTFSKSRDAILQLSERSFDLILADMAFKDSSPIDFLAKARRFLPFTLRAIYEASPGTSLDARNLVNDAGLSAIFTGSINLDQLRWLMDHQSPSAHRSGNGANTFHSKPQTKTAEPVVWASAAKGNKKQASPVKETAPVAPPTPDPVSSPEVSIDAPSPAVPPASSVSSGDEIVFCPTAPDLTAEVSRVLDLLFARPDITLPVLPQVGMEVQKLIAREDTSFEQIADKVGLDQSMSARILEVANSPLYAGVEQIRSIPHAVSRIGLRETRNILQVVSAENLFKTRDKKIATRMAMLWMHGLACAYSNEILAKTLSISESENFFTMGFLHDIGKLLIIHLISEGYRMKIWTPADITDSLLDDLLSSRHNDFGFRLVQRWGYPDAFSEVVKFHNDDEQIQKHDEAVIVTYFSNLLTRKMNLSLRAHDESLLDRREIAQSLNMSQQTRAKIEKSLSEMINKIKATFCKN